MNLRILQRELREWCLYNFPETADSVMHQTLGMAEEVGELCHAVLKNSQKIRNFEDIPKYRLSVIDAVCDCFIYGLNALSALNVDAEEALEKTASEVMKRNWRNNPSGNSNQKKQE